MVVVKMLIERGFKVTSTSCETNHMFLGHPYIEKVTHIQLEFGALYPMALFSGLPPNWVHYEYHTVDDNRISDYYKCYYKNGSSSILVKRYLSKENIFSNNSLQIYPFIL